MPVNITGPFGQTLTAQTMLERNAQLSVSVADGGSFSFRYFFSENEIKPMAGAAAGMSIVLGAARSFGVSVGSASGVAAAVAIAASLRSAEGIVAGAASVTGLGAAVRTSVGFAGGTSVVTGVTLSSGASVGQAVGAATVSGVATALSEAPGDAAGQSVVSGVGASVSIVAASGNSAGQSTVSGTTVAVNEAAGSASGASTVSGVTAAVAPDLVLVSFDDETDTVTLTANQDGDLDWALASGTNRTYSGGVFSGADVLESGDAGTYTVAGGTQDFSPTYTNAADGANTLVIGITNANGSDTVETAFVPIITRETVGSSDGVAAVSGVGSSSLVASGAGSSAGVATVSGVGADAGSSGITPTYVSTTTDNTLFVNTKTFTGLIPSAGDYMILLVTGVGSFATDTVTIQGAGIPGGSAVAPDATTGVSALYIGAWLVSATGATDVTIDTNGIFTESGILLYEVTGGVAMAADVAAAEAPAGAVSLASVPAGAAVIAIHSNRDNGGAADGTTWDVGDLAGLQDRYETGFASSATSTAILANGTTQSITTNPAFSDGNPGAPEGTMLLSITDS